MLTRARLALARLIAPRGWHIQRTRRPRRDPVTDAMVRLGVAAFNSAHPGDFVNVPAPVHPPAALD